jgi:nucleoside-diphosphate-sugar epimerase
MYGPYDSKDKFLPWLMHQIIQTENNIPLTSGEQERDFIYIDDVVSAYLSVLEKLDELELHNKADLTSGRFMKLKEFILIVANEIAKTKKNDVVGRLKFGSILNRKGETINLDLDDTLIQKIDWSPKIDFETGIQKLIEKEVND